MSANAIYLLRYAIQYPGIWLTFSNRHERDRRALNRLSKLDLVSIDKSSKPWKYIIGTVARDAL